MPKTTKNKRKAVFGVLILTHGRPDRVITMKALENSKYTGPVKFLVDNEDATVDAYRERFGSDNVIVFDKLAVSETIDEMDNFHDRRAIVYARNASFDIAKSLGWTHFIQLDDDYTEFRWLIGPAGAPVSRRVRNLDRVFRILLEFMLDTPTDSIALVQSGDLMGGHKSKTATLATVNLGRRGKRKAMNTFVCDVDKPIPFMGRLNEDVNVYTLLGSRGALFFSANPVKVNQLNTQQHAGGMTAAYLEGGTYVKSFYSVMGMPSAVKVKVMGTSYPRLHHGVTWKHCIPKILDEAHKKPSLKIAE